MRQFMLGLSTEIEEAALLDGAGRLRVLFRLTIPMTSGPIATLSILGFIGQWNDYFWPLVVLSPRNPTVQVAVSTLASGYVQDYALVLTGTFVSIIPLLVVFVVLGRKIISGIMQGAVKG